MAIDLICLDADDTLWHDLRHFVQAEEALLALLAPFADAHVARRTLEASQARNLRIYGYGAKGFTLSSIETAIQLGGDALPIAAVHRILDAGRCLLEQPIELLPGVEQALDALSDRGRLVLVTKGDLLHQEVKLAASGLGERFSGVEIVSRKDAATYRSVIARHGSTPETTVMAGDSLRSDVLPALAAGAWAAHVPQLVVWSHERADEPVGEPRFRQLASLTELPAWLDAIARGPISRNRSSGLP